jgi:uncharacterized LabA/DUF88 family protein
MSVYVYIDAAHLRESLPGLGVEWRNINLRYLAYDVAEPLTRRSPPDVKRIFVYDTPADTEVLLWLERNNLLPDVHLRRGSIAGDGHRRRQKGVDIRLAVDALSAAFDRQAETIVLIAGDADFTPLVGEVRDRGPQVFVAAFEGKLSHDLREEADRFYPLWTETERWTKRLSEALPELTPADVTRLERPE